MFLPRHSCYSFRRVLKRMSAGVSLWLGIVLFLAVSSARAQSSFSYAAAYDFLTENAEINFHNSGVCSSPNCVYLPAPGAGTGQVSSSDWMVGQGIWMRNLANGEQVSWAFTTPAGYAQTFITATYDSSSDCFVISGGTEYCGTHDNLGLAAYALINSCNQTFSLSETGQWAVSTYDNGALLYTNQFQISRNPSSLLAITSPSENQLYQLQQGNYNATGNVTFSAGTNTRQTISWTAKLHYQSYGGYPNPATDPTPLTFQGASYTYSGYQAIGGQILTTAQITDSDGSTVSDCTTFYVEGPESGIPNATITARLDQLYPASSSYLQYLNDGTATPNLFTGVAMKESTYRQFDAPPNNPDLFALNADFSIAAKWPLESPTNPSGQYIGLLQVATTDPDAWDWTSNTQDGVNLFSGSSGNKVQTVVTDEGYIIHGYTNSKSKISLPAHINGDGSYLRTLAGLERENNALILYGGWLVPPCGSSPSLTCTVNSLYYLPQCPSPGIQVTNKQGNLVCQGGTWQWVTNGANQSGGIGYVTSIRGLGQ